MIKRNIFFFIIRYKIRLSRSDQHHKQEGMTLIILYCFRHNNKLKMMMMMIIRQVYKLSLFEFWYDCECCFHWVLREKIMENFEKREFFINIWNVTQTITFFFHYLFIKESKLLHCRFISNFFRFQIHTWPTSST